MSWALEIPHKNELKLAKILVEKPTPTISAQSWVVLDRKSKQVLFGSREKEIREVASLTKIMTLYTCLQMVDSLQVDLNHQIFVDSYVTQVSGTTANLCPGDRLTLWDIMHGLMLPSGNDAAL